EKAGPKAMLVFERESRQPLTKGVPGLYTKDGYYKYFNPKVETNTVQLAEEESWVLGSSRTALATSGARSADAGRRLSLEAYRRTWRPFIADITIIRDRDLAKTIEITRTLSAPDTPLKILMKA